MTSKEKYNKGLALMLSAIFLASVSNAQIAQIEYVPVQFVMFVLLFGLFVTGFLMFPTQGE